MKFAALLPMIFLGFVFSAGASYMPPFDLDYCVGEAKTIVRGNLDPQGTIQVAEVLRKPTELPPTLKLFVGDSEYDYMQRVMGGTGPLEIIVFLDEDSDSGWRFVQHSPAIVGFKEDDVFLVEGSGFGNSMMKSRQYNKASFLLAVQDATKRQEERERLAALPHSAERTAQLIRFAIQNDQRKEPAGKFLVPRARQYELGQIAKSLENPNTQEQNTILNILRLAKTPGEQAVVLKVVEWIPLKEEAMDVVADYLPRTNAPEVREAAMNALHSINGYKAVDYLVPYLVLDDPQLATVLGNFGSQSYPPQDQLLNIHAVDALKKLAESMIGPDEIPVENGYASGAVSGQLAHYLHPQLMPILYKRAIHDDSSSSAQVFSNFRSAIGLQYSQEDKASWEAWWKKAQPLLEGDFNLQTAAGRERWMDHYAQADPATQKVLMNLWFFEPTVDEAALVEAAMMNDSAKFALSELWQRHRLSADTKKTIVQRFMTFRLVNQPPEGAWKDKTLYGASVESFMTFPFPMVAEFHNRMDISLGDRLPAFQGDYWGISCMGYLRVDKPMERSNGVPMTSNHFPSPPQARAVVEYYESDFPRSHDILWRLRWELGPIQLYNDKP